MQVLIYIGLILLGGLLNFIIGLKGKPVHSLANGYLFLALLLSLVVWIFYFAGIKNAVILDVLSFIMEWGGMLGHLILGYLTGNILLVLSSPETPVDNYPLKTLIRATLWSISTLVCNSFILATVGKATNMPYMIGFFKQSGYAIWFLYFIMTVEVLGGLGVVLHFKLRTGPLAAVGLMFIMFGAVYTHFHNKDPFSDSYAAVSQLISLSLMLVLYYFEKQAHREPPVTSIYVI